MENARSECKGGRTYNMENVSMEMKNQRVRE